MKKETWEEIKYIVGAETRSADEILDIAREIIRALREELERDEPYAFTNILNMRKAERELNDIALKCVRAEDKYE